jgi:hypothetical protein
MLAIDSSEAISSSVQLRRFKAPSKRDEKCRDAEAPVDQPVVSGLDLACDARAVAQRHQ